MQIKNFKKEENSELSRVAASVIWEDNNQPNRDIYFETTNKFKNDLSANPNAFLTGCILPAMYLKEKRIKIEGAISQALYNGLLRNMQLLRRWYGWKYKPVKIEARIAKNDNSKTKQNKKVGLFFSGGIDSLFSLRSNRLNFALNHPYSISDCLIIYGFDIFHDPSAENKTHVFERAVKNASDIANDACINLIPIATNIRHLYSYTKFWTKWFHGAALSSVAHCFSSRIGIMNIASTDSIMNLQPWGSHPRLDKNYSSEGLRIVHDKLASRIEKIKMLADWDIALQKLRVCTQNHDELLNCGKCIKCIKTMVMLLAIGKLRYATAFPRRNITVEELKMAFRHQSQIDFNVNYLSLAELLENEGQHELAMAIRKDAGFKGTLRRLDQQYLGNNLAKLYSLFLKSP
ncbi:MAG: hypothetical protein COV72_02965 [Candidatus Omnitrophica bacterium CG11_big_fil_rev_8_21_14_0_20_42_13]|uniref:Uncharacterized protein n=1 Tax=Candidatus Ghiorseimicrobium undicola TaxID=1974746 RepID=A0A2H0M0N6_9BACT|nr:MAG: hypothetical protein COV72_02965 [Candidatus Omnitrophica bacterium CG11_big_fil_rev_8_21_14_0_20_42_13]